MTRFNADGYWLLHNHPSGKSSASPADINFTKNAARAVSGLLGHVIIDHNEYTTIGTVSGNPDQTTVEYDDSKGKMPLKAPNDRDSRLTREQWILAACRTFPAGTDGGFCVTHT
jgi:hypothetical protein